jgi:hypothetical protein
MAYIGIRGKEVSGTDLNGIHGDNPVVFVVSGSTRWGHALLNTISGWFHVTELGAVYPRWIPTPRDFDQYLQDDDKYVLGTLDIADISQVTNLADAIRTSLGKRWFWGGFVHNCLNYVEHLLQKAGSRFKFSGTNLPVNGLKQVQTLANNKIISSSTVRTKKEAVASGKRR